MIVSRHIHHLLPTTSFPPHCGFFRPRFYPHPSCLPSHFCNRASYCHVLPLRCCPRMGSGPFAAGEDVQKCPFCRPIQLYHGKQHRNRLFLNPVIFLFGCRRRASPVRPPAPTPGPRFILILPPAHPSVASVSVWRKSFPRGHPGDFKFLSPRPRPRWFWGGPYICERHHSQKFPPCFTGPLVKEAQAAESPPVGFFCASPPARHPSIFWAPAPAMFPLLGRMPQLLNSVKNHSERELGTQRICWSKDEWKNFSRCCLFCPMVRVFSPLPHTPPPREKAPKNPALAPQRIPHQQTRTQPPQEPARLKKSRLCWTLCDFFFSIKPPG